MFEEHKPKITFSKENYFKITQKKYKDLKIKNIKKKFVIGLLRMNQFNIKLWPYSIFTFQCFFNIFQKIMLCVSSSNIDRIKKPNVFFDQTNDLTRSLPKVTNLKMNTPFKFKKPLKNKKLQKTIWLNNKKTVNSLYATPVYRTKQFFWRNKKMITMFKLKEDKQLKKTPLFKRGIFFKIESKKIKTKLLNKSYNSMSLYSQYKTGLLNKQKINPQTISKYQSSILKIISNHSFYLYLKQIGVDTRTLTNNELGLYRNFIQTFTKCIFEENRHSIDKQNSFLKIKKCSIWGASSLMLTCLKSINLAPFIISYKAPYSVNFPFKTPMCFFSEQYQPTFLFNNPWQIKQFCVKENGPAPFYKGQNKNVINLRNNFIKTRLGREISRIIESNSFKKVISSYLLKINKVEMISKNNNGNFILNPLFKWGIPPFGKFLSRHAWENKKILSVSSGICIENVKKEPCSLNTNNTHQKSAISRPPLGGRELGGLPKIFEISKTFSNLSSSFFLPIIEYSLVNNLAKSIPVCLSPSGIDLALQREAFIAASINNLTKSIDVQNATNPTTETQSGTLSNSSIFLNHIDNKKFLFGINGPMLASLATGSPTSNNSFLRFRQSNEELSLNNKASLYKTEFISYINNSVNSQFPFMKTYSYSSIEGEFIYQKKKLRGPPYGAKINFEPPDFPPPFRGEGVGALYNELIGLKKRTSKSEIGKIIRQKFTDYFITNKTIDYSCMILTKKDQLSYSFSNLGLKVSNNLINNETTQYNNYVALNLGIEVQNKPSTETNKPKIFIKQSNQKYKEIYFTLEKLKKKNQYLINDIVINLLNLLISSTNYNFSPISLPPKGGRELGGPPKTSETTSMLKEPGQNKKTECADDPFGTKFEIHELFSGLVTLDTLDGRIQTINSDNVIDSFGGLTNQSQIHLHTELRSFHKDHNKQNLQDNMSNYKAGNNNVEISNTTEIKTEVQNVSAIKLNKIPAGFAQQKSKLLIGEFLVYGDKIHPTLAISKGGQIIHINNKKITLRKGQPIFISPQAILHKYDGDFVDEQSSVITLAYQQLKTGDIVQGIPKIEQFFEARTTKRGRLFKDSLENLLKALFNRYNLKLSREQAVRQSFYKIQQIIIDGVQRVYRSQGVTIADKHLEVIVKQMTSKVRITFGGSTGYLPGEICDLYDIELLNKEIRPKILYEPIVLGITKASLEVKSFLSAASFQQTTRVLTKAALSRKNDYLNGLKENVILGNLIPAGTGYLVYLDQFSTYGFTTNYGKTKD